MSIVTDTMIPLESFHKAYDIIQDSLNDTRLIKSDYYSQLTKGQIYFKPENLQKTGSYKVRGALYKMSQMTLDQKAKGLIAASAGNHAQGVAFAAQKEGIAATIVMPKTTPLLKINETKSYGAHVILAGEVYDDAYHLALQLSKEHDYTLLHPFDDLDIATGQGTMFLEIIEQLPDIDVLLVPIGGGGLIAGIAMLAKQMKPDIVIIGVEPSGAASMSEALKHGCPCPLACLDTIAEGTAVKQVGSNVFPVVAQYVDDIILVDDIELVDAFLSLIEKHKIVVENAGLLSVAALNKVALTDKNVVSILSGGNIDVLTMSQMIQRGLLLRDRLLTFSVQLSNKPGELAHISELIAMEQGNVIKLEHNQFSSMDRFSQVELIVTIETFGTDHKYSIIQTLANAGYPITVAKKEREQDEK